MERRLPTVWGTSAELGDPEPTLGNPIGLVLERLTVPDLKDTKRCHKKHKVRLPKIQVTVIQFSEPQKHFYYSTLN